MGHTGQTVTDESVYDADYFLRGKESGKSLYQDYRWLPELTIPMANRMVSHLGIKPDDIILDFGCARGYTVRAFRQGGYSAWGYDVSRWALENADPIVKDYLIVNESALYSRVFDWIIAKDVLEHIPAAADTVTDLMCLAQVGVFAVVPLSVVDAHPYAVKEYEEDITHVHRLTLASWARMFTIPGWSVTVSYRVPGIKDNYAKHEWGNGFIVARRISDTAPVTGGVGPVPVDAYQEIAE